MKVIISFSRLSWGEDKGGKFSKNVPNKMMALDFQILNSSCISHSMHSHKPGLEIPVSLLPPLQEEDTSCTYLLIVKSK